MADELPSGDRAVYNFLEMVALAFVFVGAENLWNGKSWTIWSPAFACSVLFFVVAVKFPRIKAKFVSVDWNLWNKRLYWVNYVLLVVVTLAFITVAARTSYRWWHPPVAPAVASEPSVTPSISRVDWHDRRNWRQRLRKGMTRTEVRQLFGDPERISVISSTELWEYGSGEVQFDMESHPDGSLDVWFEPSR